jgi:nucleoid-associated protein YgaU
VRRGDSLWAIAKMPRHYGRGAFWTKIWRANEKKIPDFDIIYPRQVLLIPKNNSKAKV